MTRHIKGLAAAAMLVASVGAQATLLTSSAGYSGPGLDFTAYANGAYNFTFGPKPIPGGITFTSNVINSNSGNGSVLGQGGYGLDANGSFDSTRVYAGLDGPLGFMSFIFDSAVSSFGAFMNYAITGGGQPYGANPIIGAYDINGALLEEWDLLANAPINTPGAVNAFEFRGISRNAAEIKEFRMSNSYLLAAATANGDPRPPVTTVPEPTTTALLGLGLLAMLRQRRRA